LNRAYRGCPDGPVGERTEVCDTCKGEGVLPTKLGEFEPCYACGGYKQVKVVGLPLVDPALTKERKAQGWREA